MAVDEAGKRLRLEKALSEYLQSEVLTDCVEAIPAYAMSMHTALDADCYAVEVAGRRCFVKLHHGELAAPPDHALAASAARMAAGAGIAPRLLAYLPGQAATIFEHAPTGWRTAMRADFDDADIRCEAMATLRRWHGVGRLGSPAPVWRFIDTTLQALDAFLASGSPHCHIAAPHDYEQLRAAYLSLLKVMATPSDMHVPLHGEVLASNFLIGAGKRVMLVDFDRAADGDPLWDLAGLALAFDTPDAEHAGLIEEHLSFPGDDAVVRLRANMLVQDIGWGLWARLAHFLSPRADIEFFKYGETRLARARGRLMSYAALFRQDAK
jgi:hypothetical protein